MQDSISSTIEERLDEEAHRVLFDCSSYSLIGLAIRRVVAVFQPARRVTQPIETGTPTSAFVRVS